MPSRASQQQGEGGYGEGALNTRRQEAPSMGAIIALFRPGAGRGGRVLLIWEEGSARKDRSNGTTVVRRKKGTRGTFNGGKYREKKTNRRKSGKKKVQKKERWDAQKSNLPKNRRKKGLEEKREADL